MAAADYTQVMETARTDPAFALLLAATAGALRFRVAGERGFLRPHD